MTASTVAAVVSSMSTSSHSGGGAFSQGELTIMWIIASIVILVICYVGYKGFKLINDYDRYIEGKKWKK